MKTVALFSLLGVAAGAKPEMPTQYTARVTMTMPYYDFVEPIDVWYDGDAGLGRLDYWGGVDRYIYNSSGIGYQIVPTTSDGLKSDETCFTTGESGEVDNLIFPDLTYFPDDADEATTVIDGEECESWTLRSPTFNDTTGFDGNYTIYVKKSDGTPRRFQFTGFNVILGSHYDEYIFDYLTIDTSAPAQSAFLPPSGSMTCEELETDDGDDGPTTGRGKGLKKRPAVALDTPLQDLKSLMPSAEGARVRAARFEEFLSTHLQGQSAFEGHDFSHRASLFGATVKFVNAMNRKRLSYWLGLNQFAHLTNEEKKQYRGRLHTPEGTVVPATKSHVASLSTAELPDSVDWVAAGAVTPPKDQGTCGSCWSYGATGTTEGQLFRKTGVLTPLSQQNLMDCSWNEGNHACDGGLDFRGYEWMLAHDGSIATEATYPYLNSDGYCRFESSTVGATITGYANLSGTVADLNDALATIGPISVSVDAAPNSFYFYQGGLYYDEECKSGMGDLDHTVLAVGYETVDGQIYTTVKNSWSNHWGDGGFIHVSQENNCCGVATQPTYTIL